MRIYRLKRTQLLPVPMNTAWQFFSDPGNLPEITPPWLGFRLTQKTPESVYAGMIISYRLTPLPYLTVNWTTEITHLKAPDFLWMNSGSDLTNSGITSIYSKQSAAG